MSTFYIVRHGQSIANSQKIMQGAMIDTPLTTTGQAQAHKTAAKLSQHNFTQVFASPLLRAAQTAQMPRSSFLKQLLHTTGVCVNLTMAYGMGKKPRNYGGNMHNFLIKIIIYYPAHKNILTVKHTHKQRRDSSVSLTKRPKSCRKTHKFYWSATVTPLN